MTHWGANRNCWSSLTRIRTTGRFLPLHQQNWERHGFAMHCLVVLEVCMCATGSSTRWNYVYYKLRGAWGNISTQAWSSARFSAALCTPTLKPLATKPYLLTYSALPRLQIYSKYVGLCLKPEKRARHFENCGGNFYHIYKTFTWRLTSHLRSILIFCICIYKIWIWSTALLIFM